MASPIINNRRLAEIISNLTNPALVLVVSLAIIASRYTTSTQQLLDWTAVGLLLLVVPGFLYATISWRQEKQIDLDLTRREDRVVPLLLTTLGAVIIGYIVSDRFGNHNLRLISNILVTMLVSLTIVTLVWKISLHAATMMALVTLIIIFRGSYFAVFYLGIIPVAWARLTLKQHTVAQVLAGSIIGIITTVLVALLFRVSP